MGKLINRIGETSLAKNGQIMTIIACRSAIDIDVQFEDGTIIKNCYYHLFVRANVKYPDFLKKQRLGMTKTMKCGMNATIIEYKDASHMVIEFEDGYIKHNVPFKDFDKGITTNPNLYVSKQRVGTTKIQSQGFVAKIIEYQDSQNITVQFEDGEVKKTCWDTFNKGKVAHPSVAYNKDLKDDVLGKTYRTNCGLFATVIKYTTNRKLIVQFEDGEIKQTQLNRLEGGYVGHPKLSITQECKYKNFVF